MDVIFIDIILCELATNHKIISICAEGLDVNRGPDNLKSWKLALESTIQFLVVAKQLCPWN